jgi:hypothetical protein
MSNSQQGLEQRKGRTGYDLRPSMACCDRVEYYADERIEHRSHHSNEANLKAEVLALRRQVQVLERQIERVRWEPGDRMILAALRERLPRSAWAALLVQPETVLGWHRELVRRR